MDSTARAYSVAVIGFNMTERIVLQSIFGLAARRTPKFVPFDGGQGKSPDVFLVDASTPEYLQQLRESNSGSSVPTILVGDSNFGTTWPAMPRPLQWSRLLKMLDEVIATARTQTVVPSRQVDSVLVVDDSPTVRQFMQGKLAPFGFNVDFAASGEQAIGLTAEKAYTVVFLDVVLPGVDGYQVCKLVKSKKREIKGPAVVMLTSKGSPFDKIRGTMAGCDAYLTKPIDEDKLLAAIAKFLPNAVSPRLSATRAA